MPAATTARPPLRAETGGARMAFTGRAQGNLSLVVGGGEPRRAREGLAGLVGLQPTSLVVMEQVHGATVARVGLEERGRGVAEHATALPAADALVTTEPGVGLVVLAADCVPVLLVAPGRGVAAVHAGRRGVAGGVVSAGVAALSSAASAASVEMFAVLGPAIGGCCYEVPGAIADEVAAAVPEARCRTAGGTTGLDLPDAVRRQLAEAGVATVAAVGSCTRCGSDRWFSHRASAEGAAVGRQGAVVALSGFEDDTAANAQVLAEAFLD